jgi:hypothetical protein
VGKKIVSQKDHYVLAINSEGTRHAPVGNSIPYFIQAFLGFGPLVFAIELKNKEVTDSGYQYRPEVFKKSGASVSTRAFLDQDASFCSAVLHSGVDCANHPDDLGGEFSVLHNPNAQRPLDLTVFDWCEQFVFKEGKVNRLPPKRGV